MEQHDLKTNVQQSHRAYMFLSAFVAAVGGFLFGYDLNIIAGAQIYLREQFNLTDAQFGFAMGSALLGCIAGPIVGAWFCDKLGRRNSLVLASVLFGISAIWTAIPKSIITFDIFRFVGGVGVGLASVASPMYIAEIAPKKIRGALVTMNQLAIVVGSLCAIIVAYFLAEYLPEDVSWRWMFASELVPIIIFVILLLTLSETPRWLAERHRTQEAMDIMAKINGPEEGKREMIGLLEEIEHEKEMPKVAWAEMFLPGIRKAVMLGVILSLIAQWTGWSMIAFYMPTIFQQAGIDAASEAIKWTIIPNIANLFFTFIAIYTVDKLGRRPLYLICSLAMAFATSLLGLVLVFNITGWPVVVVICLTAAPHAIGLGALSWLVISEIFPTRIRAKAMGFCTIFLWVACYIGAQVIPSLFTVSKNWFGSSSGVFFLAAGICVVAFIYLLKSLPETKGRSLEEIASSWLEEPEALLEAAEEPPKHQS